VNEIESVVMILVAILAESEVVTVVGSVLDKVTIVVEVGSCTPDDGVSLVLGLLAAQGRIHSKVVAVLREGHGLILVESLQEGSSLRLVVEGVAGPFFSVWY
jgi:hypothetical protein